MTLVSLPGKDEGAREERGLAFYLAMEEYVAEKFTGGEFFFLWRTAPSVIFGRNQLMEAEVNVPYCREHGIRIFRRKSGGGCVYSDKGNIMHSFICHAGPDPMLLFSSYMQRIALVLKRLGLNADVSRRNDVTVDGLKVSGNAFHLLPGRCIIHGTLLFDTDLQAMSRAITPPAEKLERKGISSVRQRVMNLKGLVDMDIDEFMEYICKTFCKDRIMLGDEDVARIEEMEKEYLEDSFIIGKNPRH